MSQALVNEIQALRRTIMTLQESFIELQSQHIAIVESIQKRFEAFESRLDSISGPQTAPRMTEGARIGRPSRTT